MAAGVLRGPFPASPVRARQRLRGPRAARHPALHGGSDRPRPQQLPDGDPRLRRAPPGEDAGRSESERLPRGDAARQRARPGLLLPAPGLQWPTDHGPAARGPERDPPGDGRRSAGSGRGPAWSYASRRTIACPRSTSTFVTRNRCSAGSCSTPWPRCEARAACASPRPPSRTRWGRSPGLSSRHWTPAYPPPPPTASATSSRSSPATGCPRGSRAPVWPVSFASTAAASSSRRHPRADDASGSGCPARPESRRPTKNAGPG